MSLLSLTLGDAYFFFFFFLNNVPSSFLVIDPFLLLGTSRLILFFFVLKLPFRSSRKTFCSPIRQFGERGPIYTFCNVQYFMK